MARFRVTATFRIPARQHFGVSGEVVEGTITPGMYLVIPGTSIPRSATRIDSFELIRTIDGTELGLNFHCADGQELQAWQRLELDGMELDVVEEPGQSGASNDLTPHDGN